MLGRLLKPFVIIGIRADVDDRNEKMQYKIRASQTSKIPYQLIVGDKEMQDKSVNVRRYGSKATHTEAISAFVDNIWLILPANHAQLKAKKQTKQAGFR